MQAHKWPILNILLIIAVALENIFLFFGYRQFHFSQFGNAAGLFLSSVAVGFILLYKFYGHNITLQPHRLKITNRASYLLLGSFILALFLLGFKYLPIFRQNPIGPQYSDIIPEIQVACKRFLSGENVYTPITEFGWKLELTYLPAQWLPFIPAQVMKFDYRWVALGIWIIAALTLFLNVLRTNNLSHQGIAAMMIIGGNYVLIHNNPGIVASTVEIMIAGYYMLLIIGLNQKNAIFLGLALAACILSRFSLLLWLPLGAFTMYTTGKRKQLLIACITVLLAVLLIYVIPFLSRDWESFYRGYKYYDNSAMGEWRKHTDEQYPMQLHSGIGFAYTFYEKLSGIPVFERLKLLQKTHLILSFGITVLMGVWYWLNKKLIDYRIFLQASLKIYLAFFLAFIQVPYEYLMIVGNFVSIAIICEQLRFKKQPVSIATK